MTPKTLFAMNVTVHDPVSYDNSAAPAAGKRWIIKSITICPVTVNSTYVFMQLSLNSTAYQRFYNFSLHAGETVEDGPIVLTSADLLKFEATNYAYDVIAVGYEETIE